MKHSPIVDKFRFCDHSSANGEFDSAPIWSIALYEPTTNHSGLGSPIGNEESTAVAVGPASDELSSNKRISAFLLALNSLTSMIENGRLREGEEQTALLR
jgi:hypothetical protein